MHFGWRQPAKVIKGSVVKKESDWLEAGLVHVFKDIQILSKLQVSHGSPGWKMLLARDTYGNQFCPFGF